MACLRKIVENAAIPIVIVVDEVAGEIKLPREGSENTDPRLVILIPCPCTASTIALTPFTDEGDLDDESIGSLAEFYLNSGVHGVTILGLMGEAHKLSDAERQAVTERYVSAIGGRVPVVVGCSAVATKVVVERV